MMRATLDLIGLYNHDNTLLDNLHYPSELDGDILKNNLLLESAELEVLYSDIDFMKSAIDFWSSKQLHVWEELLKTTQYEYNPIWNKDGVVIEERDLTNKEDTKDNVDRVDNLTDKNTRNFSDTEIRDTEDKETKDLQDDNLNSVYGFNENNEAPANRDLLKATGTDTIEHSGSNELKHTGTDTIDHTGRQDVDRTIDRTIKDTGKITRTEQGNIGLTSTQQLIREQREVVDFNIYNIIINDFIDRFCLKIY